MASAAWVRFIARGTRGSIVSSLSKCCRAELAKIPDFAHASSAKHAPSPRSLIRTSVRFTMSARCRARAASRRLFSSWSTSKARRLPSASRAERCRSRKRCDRAIEIGGALDKAHRQGIVHRDLKPANIMLMKSGREAARFRAREEGRRPSAVLARVGRPRTDGAAGDDRRKGRFSAPFNTWRPSSSKGERADARTDIFALGAVLYEMVTGIKAFEGKSQVSLIAAILEREPAPVSACQVASPPALDAVVKRCLAKDPDERWQSAGDLAAALRFLRGSGSGMLCAAGSGDTSAVSARRSRAWIPLAAVLASTVVLAALLGYRLWLTPEQELVRFELSRAAEDGFRHADCVRGGRRCDLARRSDARVYRHGRGVVRRSCGCGRSIPRRRGRSQEPRAPGCRFGRPTAAGSASLRKVSSAKFAAAGGAPEIIADAPNGRGGTWSAGGTIVFAPNAAGALSQVSANGGEPTVLTTPVHARAGHRSPSFLPDGRRFLYFARRRAPAFTSARSTRATCGV